MLVRLHKPDNSVTFMADAMAVYINEELPSKLHLDFVDGTHQTISTNDPNCDHVSVGDSDVFTPYGDEWKHSKTTSKSQLNG